MTTLIEKTDLEALRDARAKIERGWCQSLAAMDKCGCGVSPRLETACMWCIIGAIAAVAFDLKQYYRMFDLLGSVVGVDVVIWNDAPGRTQAEVLAAFDRAIEIEEGKG